MFDRRSFLKAVLAAQAFAALPGNAFAARQSPLKFGPEEPFSYAMLKAKAEELAKAPYSAPPRPDAAIVAAIDYDAHGKLKYKPDFALFGDDQPGAFPITFMHVGEYFPKTVQMHAIDADGKGGEVARKILYDPSLFEIPADSVAARLAPEPSSFAGFWLREPKAEGIDWRKEEPWVTFLGASYFRAKGELGQVGMSARGIALTPGGYGPEEFPDFVAFWFTPAPSPNSPQVIYALLDGPSVSGAYRIAMERTKGVVMDFEVALYFRAPVERLGLAPLTSMYWYSETLKQNGVDWRPEVHDSDGLALWTATGERIWRPLNNPASIIVSSFADDRPRGFGLLQRDRNFDHYLDGVGYEKRPSTWVEPVGDWGRGAVQLVEIPTNDEIMDNIIAYWNPEKPVAKGDQINLRYRIHWLKDEPYPTPLAAASRLALGAAASPGRHALEARRSLLSSLSAPHLRNSPTG